VRGLWYFFGIVIAAGIFSGITGLGIGYVGGVLWEQIHRHRRRERLEASAVAEGKSSNPASTESRDEVAKTPSLHLISLEAPDLPEVQGLSVASVRFHARSIQLELGTVRLEITANPLIVCGLLRSRYPEPGSRDALCSLIGDRVTDVRSPSAERIEIHFQSGCELVIPRSAVAVA
jgi:hypothetical protein